MVRRKKEPDTESRQLFDVSPYGMRGCAVTVWREAPMNAPWIDGVDEESLRANNTEILRFSLLKKRHEIPYILT